MCDKRGGLDTRFSNLVRVHGSRKRNSKLLAVQAFEAPNEFRNVGIILWSLRVLRLKKKKAHVSKGQIMLLHTGRGGSSSGALSRMASMQLRNPGGACMEDILYVSFTADSAFGAPAARGVHADPVTSAARGQQRAGDIFASMFRSSN